MAPDADASPDTPEPIPLCEVAVGPAPSPDSLLGRADARGRRVLPAVRAGAPWRYDSPVPGALVGGTLPDGLGLEGADDGPHLVGVVPSDALPDGVAVDHLLTFETPEGLVERLLTVHPQTPAEGAARPLHAPGPYGTFDSQPADECPANPTMTASDGTSIDLFVTWPTLGDPATTGDGTVATGRWPVIVFAHANNDRVCDINERYRSLFRHWASYGYLVVAPDGTRHNCMRGSTENIRARTDDQLDALDALDVLDDDPASPLYGHVDFDRVVLAGHSRGGGASKWGAITDARVRAVLDLQGVNYGFGVEPLPAVPVLGLSAGEDVDLDYPHVEPTEDHLTGPYVWVTLFGAIHAWTADNVPIEPDDQPLITQEEQHGLTRLVTTAFLGRFVGLGDGDAPATFAPDPTLDALVFTHRLAEQADATLAPASIALRANRGLHALSIDRFDDPDSDRNDLGGLNVVEGPLTSAEVFTYAPDAPNTRGPLAWGRSRRLEAADDAGTLWLSPPDDPLPIDVGARLVARVKGPDGGAPGTLSLVLADADGHEVVLPAAPWMGPAPLTNRFVNVSVPLGALPASLLTGGIARVGLRVAGGALFVDDLRLE